MNPLSPDGLEAELAELRARIWRMEQALQRRGLLEQEAAAQVQPPIQAEAPKAIPTPAPPAMAGETEPSTPLSPPAPPFRGFSFSAQAAETPSLESRIGSQWFNRVGILAVLIGVAWFLKLAFDNHWIGPPGRVLIGLVAGAALIAWSERFRRRGFVAFSYSLKAIGSGALYLSLWAAFSLYALLPAGAAFAAMIAVTAFNGYLAWRQNAELLALYAIAGGLLTPLLVSTGQNHEVTLFSYLLILDLAVLVLAALRPWSRLLLVAFTGTVVLVLGWWFSYYTQAQAGRTAVFLACFFLLFALSPRLVRIDMTEAAGGRPCDNFAIIVVPLSNACLGFIAFYNLFDRAAAVVAGPWLAVMFAAFYLALVQLPARGPLRVSPAPLTALHLATAVVFLIVAIPLKTRGRWLTIGWLAEGAALLGVARRVRIGLLRGLAVLCLLLGLFALLVVHPPAGLTPVFNQRFATYCFGIAVFAFVAWLAARAPGEEEVFTSFHWPQLAAVSVLLVNVLILLAIGSEIHSYWWLLRWHGEPALVHDYRIYAQFTYSAFFMLFGAALLAVGFWRHSGFLRWQALVLLAAAIGKVFLVDVDALSQGLRILSFLGLGALLLAVSFVYQRDWPNLRGRGARS